MLLLCTHAFIAIPQSRISSGRNRYDMRLHRVISGVALLLGNAVAFPLICSTVRPFILSPHEFSATGEPARDASW